MSSKNIQHVYIYMDDSGKISKYEDYAIFAGMILRNDIERSEFINKYRSICEQIKCKYCEQKKETCTHVCPEIKGYNINSTDRRRLMQLSKKHVTFGTVIYNKNLHTDIINRTPSKGRFSEYAQRRVIKKTILHLIQTGTLSPNQPVVLHINIDEMPTKSNGYYSLQEGLYEELKHGIVNWNYGNKFKPIIHSSLKVEVNYKDSKHDYCIQMADIINVILFSLSYLLFIICYLPFIRKTILSPCI